MDDPQVHWKAETIASQILKEVESLDIDALITFDREGVSHHPNHCAIYYATASLCLARLIPNRKRNLFPNALIRTYFNLFFGRLQDLYFGLD